MKKTVSWSTESIRQEVKSKNHDTTHDEVNASTSSKRAGFSPVSKPEVNLRIQQMVAMQKAQNASMRQFMSTPGLSSASPSGLRDLVISPRSRTSSKDNHALDNKPPPATLDKNHGGLLNTSIQFQQGPPKSITLDTLPTHSGVRQESLLASHAYPEVPIINPPAVHHHNGGGGEEDSLLSYNSVLGPQKHSIAKVVVQMQEPQQEKQLYPKLLGHNLATPSPQQQQQARNSQEESITAYSYENYMNGPALPGTHMETQAMHTQHQFHYGGHTIDQQPNTNTYYNSCDIMGGTEPTRAGSGSSYVFEEGYSKIPNNASSHVFQKRRRRGILRRIFCHPLQILLSSEQLSRSFCFGAIDGILTGAGILSAYAGLGLLSQEYSLSNWIPVVLTMGATLSDAICMAIGHVWSTSLVAYATYNERKQEMLNFNNYRSDAKARLVDIFLSQGILKIDAMSLADTLEGYPDLFVSALLGGSFGEPSGCVDFRRHSELGSSSELGQMQIHSLSGKGLNNDESHRDSTHQRSDSLSEALAKATDGSKVEGFFMMLSFSSFSLIPSIIFMILDEETEFTAANGEAYQLLVCLGVAECIMFLLGAWKSHFYSSEDWFLFGLKNSGVLCICVLISYSLGSVGCSLIHGQK